MNDPVLLYEKKNHTAWLRLNRPNVMNALNGDLSSCLLNKLVDIEQDDSIRVLVITGSAPAFCAGADLKELMCETEAGEKDLIDRIVDAFNRLRHLNKPVIAAVNGVALAGGLELIMCCDLVYAADTAKMGDGHANYGVYPAAGGAAILPRLVPMCVAKKLLFTGESIEAEYFKQWGLINDIFSPDQLNTEVQKIADLLSEKSALVISRMKEVVNQVDGKSRDDALSYELLAFRCHTRSHDMREGLSAFTEKRKPDFKGY